MFHSNVGQICGYGPLVTNTLQFCVVGAGVGVGVSSGAELPPPPHATKNTVVKIEIKNKIICKIKVSFKENYQNKTIIEGQKGKLIINSPWLPEKQTNLEISQGSSYYKKIVNSDLSLYANQIEIVSDNFEKNKKDDKFLVNIQSSLAIMKNMSIWSKLIKK